MNLYKYLWFLDPYIDNKLFGSAVEQSTTGKFGGHDGAAMRVAIDCHEVRFHSRFNDPSNQNMHEWLKNWEIGVYCL